MRFYTLAAAFSLLMALSPSAKAGCDFAGALPCNPSERKEAQKEFWIGSWATRMKDTDGKSLTAMTTLKPDSTYTSTLCYDDGRKIEHSGKYSIKFTNLNAFADESETIDDGTISEAQYIDDGVKQYFPVEANYFAAALPNKQAAKCICTGGTISYEVKSWQPASLSFSSPQTFTFKVVQDGYVRVNGTGANNQLSRRYAKQ